MRKRRSSLDVTQLGFTFVAPKPAKGDAELAGLDRLIAAGVGQALRDDSRSRGEIALAMSALLAEEVTAYMLDAYASEARDQHNVPMHRALALIAVTDRHDILDLWARRIGGSLLVGEEIVTAQLGHIDRQMAELKNKRREVESRARPIVREGGFE